MCIPVGKKNKKKTKKPQKSLYDPPKNMVLNLDAFINIHILYILDS